MENDDGFSIGAILTEEICGVTFSCQRVKTNLRKLAQQPHKLINNWRLDTY